MLKRIFVIASIIALSFNLQAQNTDSAQPSDTLNIIQKVEKWYENNMNYTSVTILMAAESSILPVPSEMVIPPAVYVALKPESKLSVFWIIFFGTLGAMIGASFNYIMAMWLGRLFIYKFADSKIGKLLLLSSEKIKKSEKFFNDHGKTSTFVGRLIPVVRHLISIPAGLARMNYFNFLLYTMLGAGLWNIVLALMGYFAHGQADLIEKYSHEFSYVFLAIGVILAAWLLIKTIKKK